jgi:outer membrane protein W
MPLEADLDIRRSDDPRITLPDAIALDPLIVSLGATWRF